MLDPPPVDDIVIPAPVCGDPHIVVEFRLPGATAHSTPVEALAPPRTAEVDDLRRRVSQVERALAAADDRIEALSSVFAAAVQHFAAAAGDSGRHMAPARAPDASRPVVDDPGAPIHPIAEPPVAIDPVPEPFATPSNPHGLRRMISGLKHR